MRSIFRTLLPAVLLFSTLFSHAQTVTSSALSDWEEPASQAFDGNTYLGWSQPGKTGWIQIEYTAPVVLNRYTIVSSTDGDGARDLRNWVLTASADGVNWETLDSRIDQVWPAPYTVKAYAFHNTTAYTHYRFDFENNGNDYTQLREIAFAHVPVDPDMPSIIQPGTAYRWHSNTDMLSNDNREAEAVLNDNDLENDVQLNGPNDDNENTYQAAGLLFATPQDLVKVTYVHGTNPDVTGNGSFDAEFHLQLTYDGTTWVQANEWSFTPAFLYGDPAITGTTYTFSGEASGVLGVRVVGKVHTSSFSGSWNARSREITAFAAVAATRYEPGTAYRWHSNEDPLANDNREEAPLLNDGDKNADVQLHGPSDDDGNRYQGAGLIFSEPKEITQVVYVHGTNPDDVGNGSFDADFHLQLTFDGSTWQRATDWSLSPVFLHWHPSISGNTYTFKGNATGVLGVRIVGQVHTSESAGSWNARSREISAYSTNLVADTIAPTTVSGFSATDIGLNGYTVSWQPSVDSGGLFGYFVYRGAAYLGFTTDTSYAVDGRPCSSSDSITVVAKDFAANLSAANTPFVVQTTECPDVQAPSAPTGLVASGINAAGFELRWNSATDNKAVVGYDVYLDGILHATNITDTVLKVQGLSGNYTKFVTIKAKDAAGNISGFSNDLVVSKPIGASVNIMALVAPNPAPRGRFSLRLKNPGPGYVLQVLIYDMSGRLMHRRSITMTDDSEMQQEAFNLPFLQPGAYILTVKTMTTQLEKRFDEQLYLIVK